MKYTPAQFLSSDRQASSLIVVKAQPLVSELFAPDTVLFVNMIDDVLAVGSGSRPGKSADAERHPVPDAWRHRSTERRRKKPREISSEPRM
jgi:hypothetical protein